MSIITPKGHFSGAAVIDKNRKHLEPDELKRLFDVLQPDKFWHGLFRIQYYFGMRVSEASIIMREDVSWGTNEIILRRLKKKQLPTISTPLVDPTTGKPMLDVRGKPIKTRTVDPSAERGTGFKEEVYAIPDHLLDVLKKVPKVKDNPWLFPRHPAAAPVGRGRTRRTSQMAFGALFDYDDPQLHGRGKEPENALARRG